MNPYVTGALCGNVVHSMGESVVICHGITLPPLDAEDIDDLHPVSIEEVENEYFVSVAHDMTRTHYISFLAAVSYNRVQIVKLYPEGNAEARFKMNNVKTIYFYCNKDELFKKNVG
jgi:desulfoferrodoxin (superoxide reductase-like protein)